MSIQPLKINSSNFENAKLLKQIELLYQLITELATYNLSENSYSVINQIIIEINSFSIDEKALTKLIKRRITEIIAVLVKTEKITPHNYYRNQWMILGMSVFGIPMGVSFGLSLNNMAFLGIGLPIGMAIGIAIGQTMDKKAKDEGRQLQFKYEL